MEYEIHKMMKDDRIFYPATTTSAVVHPQVEQELTAMLTKYYMPALFPDAIPGNNWSLQTAITYLHSTLADKDQTPGVRVSYLNGNNELVEYEYYTTEYAFDNILGWRRIGSGLLNELEEAVFPVTVSFSISPGLIEVGVPTTLSLSWTTMRRGKNVTILANNTVDGDPVEGTGTNTTITIPETGNKVYTYSSTYEGITKTTNFTVKATNKTYYGIVNQGWTPGPDFKTVLGGSRLVGSRGWTWSNIVLQNQCMAYAYEKGFGALTSIKDGNGFEYLNSYQRFEVSVDNVDYYVYVLIDPTTTSAGIKQIYS